MRERTYLYDAIASNRRRIALGCFVFFVVVLLESFAVAVIFARDQGYAWKPFVIALVAAFGATIILLPLLALWAYYRGKRTILKPFWTVLPSEQEARKLHLALENVCIAAGAEEPEVRVIANTGVNAISLAKGYKEGLILVSRGAVENLDRGELEALLAHEIYHIMSHDTWMWMLGLGVSAFLPLTFSAYWSGVGKLLDEDRMPFTGALVEQFPLQFLFVLISFVIAWILLAAFWIPLWMSYFALVLPRNREYLADAQALLITRDPEAVISVLRMSDIMRSDSIRGSSIFVNHMFFNQPLKPPPSFTGSIIKLFRASPPMSKRLERIRSMG